MPWMVELPTRPSPMAAPTAPPPRARPPPIMAPAVVTAELSTAMFLLGSHHRASPAMDLGDAFCWSVKLWSGGLKLLRLGVCLVLVGILGLVVVAVAVAGGRHAEVQDREQGEDQRLDRADEDAEQLPRHGRQRRQPVRQQTDDAQHDAAGEDVAEESQRQGD